MTDLEKENAQLKAHIERLRSDLGKCASDLKAQWQAEAVESVIDYCGWFSTGHVGAVYIEDIKSYADKLRTQKVV